MTSIRHSSPIISGEAHEDTRPAASSSAASASNPYETRTAPALQTKRKDPDTTGSPSPKPKRPRGSGSHPDISNWLSSQSTRRVEPPTGSASRLSGTQGLAPDIHSPFEESFNIEEALARHGADRWDKTEDDIPPTMIHLKNSGALYSLQFDDTWSNRKVLGTGRQGKVRIACGLDGQVVAVKKYYVNNNGSPNQNPSSSIKVSEFEYFIYQRLGKGRHFPEVYDIAHARKGNDIKSYLFMELIDGEDGEKVLKGLIDGKLPTSETRTQIKHIAKEYIEAVADMHDRGVASPDMSPANFIHEPSGNVKIIDFGLAEYFSPAQRIQEGFNGFSDDRAQLGEILVGALGRVRMGLRSVYSYSDNECDYDELQDEYEKALEAMPEDDEMRRDVESLAELAAMLRNGTSPRQLLNDSYFADLTSKESQRVAERQRSEGES